MDRTLSAAASGMYAEELKMNVIADNLANANTPGHKKMRAEFQDVLYDNIKAAGSPSANGDQVPTGIQIGQGVRTGGTQRIFTMGELKQTNHSFDIAIEGDGFFQFQQANGQIAYGRDGAMKLDVQGRMVTSDGQPLVPQITVPPDAVDITVARDGTVSCRQADRSTNIELGRITIARFTNPAGLMGLGHNLYQATSASGEPYLNTPGTGGTGSLGQGFLEMSNVRSVEEMIDLVTTQRAYEMGTRVIQAADQMLGATSNIR